MHEKRFRAGRRHALRLLAGVPALVTVSSGSSLAANPLPPLATRTIPSSGEALPMLGLGTWQTFDVGSDVAARGRLRDVLSGFAHEGASIVDSSPMYGTSETVVGDLAAELRLRERLFIATKVWTRGRAEGIRQMEQSMSRLRVKRLDLMQVHNLVDVDTHTATLAEWKRDGRVRYVGITHYTSSAHGALEQLLSRARYDFVQINYSLDEPEAAERLLPLARERGVAVMVNRPFASGGMFGRVRGKPLPPWAGELGIASWAQFFLKWILGHPAVTCAIPATSKVAHMKDNLAAARGVIPDDAARRRMAGFYASL